MMQSERRYDAIFFDLYGTLVVDTAAAEANRSWTRRLGEYLVECGATVGDDESIFRGFWSRSMPYKTDTHTPFELRLIDFTRELGGEPRVDEIGPLADDLCARWQDRLPLAEATIPALDELRQTYRTAVVSNFGHPRHVRGYLSDVGVEPLVEHILVSGDYPFEKPDPRLLTEACAAVGVEPARTIYVGDSIVDYRASVAAGITPILIRRAGHRERWPDDGAMSRFEATEQELSGKVERGELVRICELSELPDLTRRLPTA